MNRSSLILMSAIFLMGICFTACAGPRSSESPLSPLEPPPAVTPPAVGTPVPPPPTSVSTATPVPSPAWTPKPPPTMAVVPTPTTRARPEFPLDAVIPAGWPALPTSLYFIREGSLWRWSSDGYSVEQVVAAPQQGSSSGGNLARQMSGAGPIGVIAYRLTPDERYLVYAFVADPAAPEPEIVVLDQTAGETFPIATATGAEFPLRGRPSLDITPDGRYVVYLAWNVLPATGSRASGLSHPVTSPDEGGDSYGTIFAVDVQNINREFELGYCAARQGARVYLRCEGFVLSPDGTRIAFSDGRGLWISDVPQGMPRLIAEHQYGEMHFCGVGSAREWSPDGENLLIDVRCYEGGHAAVMDVDTGEEQAVPGTWSYAASYVDVTWDQDGTELLVNRIDFEPQADLAYLARVSTEDLARETVVISTTLAGDVWPIESRELPDGRIAFANRQCVDSEGMQSGIYTIGRDGASLEFVSPLPAMPCYVSEELYRVWGRVLWSPGGAAYLYFAGDAPQPHLLGLTDGSALWDVRDLLADALVFQWRPRYSGYWE